VLIKNDFEVAQSVDKVWRFFDDIPQVAACLPGAELTEDLGNDSYKGKVAVRMGPVKLQFAGTAAIKERDEAGKRIVVDAAGADEKGRGQAAMLLTAKLAPVGAGTKIEVAQDLQLSGAAAQYGRGMISDVTTVLMRDFATNMQNRISAIDRDVGELIWDAFASNLLTIAVLLIGLGVVLSMVIDGVLSGVRVQDRVRSFADRVQSPESIWARVGWALLTVAAGLWLALDPLQAAGFALTIIGVMVVAIGLQELALIAAPAPSAESGAAAAELRGQRKKYARIAACSAVGRPSSAARRPCSTAASGSPTSCAEPSTRRPRRAARPCCWPGRAAPARCWSWPTPRAPPAGTPSPGCARSAWNRSC